jgi:hypothetical protein
MPLDSETPVGQVFIQEQYRIQKLLEEKGYTVINTSKKYNGTDIILAKHIDGKLTVCGVAEIKSRMTAGNKILTLDYLKENGGYLITAEKLKYGAQMSVMLMAPFFVIVSLMEDDKILIWKITDEKGEYLEKIEIRQKKTKETVNGGVAYRNNAFLPIETPNLTIINERDIN